MWLSRFKRHSDIQQSKPRINLAFTIPQEYVVDEKIPTVALFHGGIDSPLLNAIDPILNQAVHITKYLHLKSKRTSQEYFNHLYERILLTSHLSHPNVCSIFSWYVANGCLYSITSHIPTTLRHAIQSERFSIQRIRHLSEQILQGTIYLQLKGLCPLTPWYTTNIELTSDDRIRLCSPTISTTKLNGVVVQHHHLWRHAPESLIEMLVPERVFLSKSSENSKKDVWSIGCIIVEMMVHQILFHPQNDDPSLQLFSIVQFVGGLKESLIDSFPIHARKLFLTIKCDPQQRRLDVLLHQIFHQYKLNGNHDDSQNQLLYNLLSQMFRFQIDKRLSLQASIEHSFFTSNLTRLQLKNLSQRLATDPDVNRRMSIRSDDLIRLCTKLNLKNSRWMLRLKERCLLEFILQLNQLTNVNLNQIDLNQSLKIEIQNLIEFFTG